MVEKAKGGFYGLNLHYLPHKQRALFFDRLTDYSTNKKYDLSTRLRLSYNLLKGYHQCKKINVGRSRSKTRKYFY